MEPAKHMLWQTSESTPENKRRHGRVKCRDIRCTLGTVADLSASGLRVTARGPRRLSAGDCFTMTIQTLDGPMLAPVEVAWIRRNGWRKHEIGIRFREVGPALARALAALARASANNEVISPWFQQGQRGRGAA
mgnify:CR=1 FL=1